MILHHWDTDGITSAAIYLKLKGDDVLFTPKIGNYYLDDEDFEQVSKCNTVAILDMNIPEAPRLCSRVKLRIYDHHKANKVDCAVEHYNPFLWGERYPSCTVVLLRRFSHVPDYLVALGVVGDTGPKAKELDEWNIIKRVMIKHGKSFEDMQLVTSLLDSSYRLNRRKEVMDNVYLVLQGIDDVLNSSQLLSNLDAIEKEIEYWVGLAEDRGNYYFLKMRSEKHIISAVTRKLVWELGKSAIVVNEKESRDEFYIRSPDEDFNAIPLIEYAREKGYRAGGKREVMGAVLPKGEGKKFAMEIVKLLKW